MNNIIMTKTEEGEEALQAFIHILENGQPEDGFEERGSDGPARVEISQNSSDSTHRWSGYLKIEQPGYYFFRVDADDTGSITIDDKGFTVSTGGGSLSTQEKSIYLDKGYHRCLIQHHSIAYEPAEKSYEGFVALQSTDTIPPGKYVKYHTDESTLAEGEDLTLIKLYHLQKKESCPCDDDSSGGSCPESGSVKLSVSFGRNGRIADFPTGRLKLHEETLEERSFTRSALTYEHMLSRHVTEATSERVNVTTENGDHRYYRWDSQTQAFYRSGTGQIHTELLRMLDAQGSPWTGDISKAIYLEEVTLTGSAYRYLKTTGVLESYRTARGVCVSAEDMGMDIIRDADGAILQIFNETDGLLQAADTTERRFKLEWYARNAVGTKNPQTGLYTVTGSAQKSWNMGALAEDALQPETPLRFELLEQRSASPEAPVYCSLWTWTPAAPASGSFQDHWEFTRGTGTNTLTTTKLVEEINANVTRETSLALDSEGNILSREVEINTTYAFGDCITRRESGVEPDLNVTEYEYCLDRTSSQYGRMICMTDARGLVTEYEYDDKGREIRASRPWAGGGVKITETTWTDSRFNDWRPLMETEKIMTEDGTETILNTNSYSYEETDLIKRETVTRTGLHCPWSASRITEWYGAAEANTCARGRTKLIQQEDGVQTLYEYEESTEHGAAWKAIATQTVNGIPIPGKSIRDITWYDAAGRTVAQDRQAHTGEEFTSLGLETYDLDETGNIIRTHHADGRNSSTIWDCCGNPVEEIDVNGISTLYEYDAARQLIRETQEPTPVLEDYNAPYPTLAKPHVVTEYLRDAAGRVVAQSTITGAPGSAYVQRKSILTAYDHLGRTISSTDAMGRVTQYAWSPDGLLSSVTTPAGATRITAIHPDGTLRSETGTGIQHRYYSSRLTSQGIKTTVRANAEDGPLISESLEDGWGRTISSSVAGPNGAMIATTMLYNSQGRISRQETTGQAPLLTEYDALGNVTRQYLKLSGGETPDPLHDRIQQTAIDHVLEFTLPVPHASGAVYRRTRSTTWNAQGNPLTTEQKTLLSVLPATAPDHPILTAHSISRDIRGTITEQWTLDQAGNITDWEKTPGCTLNARSISVDGELLQSMDHAGIKTCYARSYLPAGDLMQETDRRGNATATRMNLSDQIICVSNAAGKLTMHEHDATTGLLMKTTHPDGTTSEYAYNLRGRKTALYGTAEQPLLWEYDEADRMSALITFRIPRNTISVNPAGRIDGDRTAWTYDQASGLLMKKTFADGTHEDSSYNDLGQLILSTKADGRSISRAYAPLTGELVSISYSDDTPDISYVHNHLGQITTISDASGTRNITYNEYGEQESEGTEGLRSYLLTFKRDSLGRPCGYTLSIRGTQVQDITLAYDQANRLLTASPDTEHPPFTWAYDAASGLPASLDYPNPLTKRITWHPQLDLVTHLDYWRPNSTNSPAKHEYDYDPLGRPTQKRDYWNTAAPGRKHDYTYNQRGELMADLMTPGNALTYAFDNIGNREQTSDQGQKTYQSNALNQYTDITQAEVSFLPVYDANGNQTQLKTSTGEWTLTWNAEDRPVTFTSQEAQLVVSCLYDDMGRRVEKTVLSQGTFIRKLRYLYNGYLQIAELDATQDTEETPAILTRTYFWDPSEPVATRVLAMTRWNVETTGRESIYFTHDLQKNTTAAFGLLGGRRGLWEYGPYGHVINSSGDMDGINPFLYSSEYHDEELGLIYYNFRHLNTLDGRWISKDPIGEPGGWNLYTLCRNNTLTAQDHRGKKVILISSFPEWDEIGFQTYVNQIQSIKATFKRWDDQGNGSPYAVKLINQFLGKWPVTVDGEAYHKSAEELRKKIKRESESSYTNYRTKKATIDAVNKALQELEQGEKYDRIVILMHGQKESGISVFADQDEMFTEDPIVAVWRKNEKIKVVSCYQNKDKKEVREMLIPMIINKAQFKPCYYHFIPIKTKTEDAE